MRGHHHCPSRLLRIHSITRAARLCLLGRPAPRPASRAVGHFVMPSFSPCFPLLVPLGVSLCLRSRLASCFSCRRACCSSPLLSFRLSRLRLSCLLPPGPNRHGSLVSPTAPCSISPRPSPRRSCRGAGRHRLACLPLSCGEVLLRVASLPLSHEGRLCFLGVVPFLSKNFPRQSFKTFLGNVLKTFPDNLLEMAKHTPSYMSRPAFLRLCRSVSPPIVSLFSLSFVFRAD